MVAQDRGAAMSPDTAAQYALMLTAPDPPPAAGVRGLARLSARERELVTLVARGRTDAQIAAELFITVRTVGSLPGVLSAAIRLRCSSVRASLGGPGAGVSPDPG